MKKLFKLIGGFCGILVLSQVGAQSYSSDSENQQDEKDSWTCWSAFSIAVPFVNYDYDYDYDLGDAGEDFNPRSFKSNGFVFDYQSYRVSPKIGLAVLTRVGFGYWNGDFKVGLISESDSSDSESEDEEAESETTYEENKYKLDGLEGFSAYLKLGLGKSFSFANNKIILIPTAGFGFNVYAMEKTDDAYSYYTCNKTSEETTKTSYSYSAVDFTLDAFINVSAMFVLSEPFGLFASCEISANLFGSGYSRLSDGSTAYDGVYTIDSFSGITFTPTIGVCLRY